MDRSCVCVEFVCFPCNVPQQQKPILSSQRRHLWRSTPLNLTVNFNFLVKTSRQECDLIAIISKILATHPGPARHLSLRCDLYARFDGWFQSSALDGLEELNFYGSNTQSLVPPTVLRFAPTLRIARIGGCSLSRIDAANVLVLHRLKQLKLYGVTISESDIHQLLVGCTMLESLDLKNIHGLSTVRIVSPTLRSIGFYVCHQANMMEFVIEDAPWLERLIQRGEEGPRTIRVITTPKLVVLGYLSSKIFKLVLGNIIVKEMIPISLTTSVRTLKVLVLESISPNQDAIVGFLRCFSYVEKLYIQSRLSKDTKIVSQYDTLDPIECLKFHLTTLVLNTYEGKRPDVNFAKFFVLNAKVLKVMKFGVCAPSCRKKWIANQHRRLQLNNRASRDARFDFKGEYDICRFYLSEAHT